MNGASISTMANHAAGGLGHILVLMIVLVVFYQAITAMRRNRTRKSAEDPKPYLPGMSRGERLAMKDDPRARQSCFRPAPNSSIWKNPDKR